ncbi:hypothetical protein CBER1_02219 [Cercospora berteroae]|uniref:Alpha/beta hydrolase fold-3 domain-containing protein n=1 Tax=Cercospora berteroae TaxID=357750 RepID=A0A2S6CB44_9PEZI|nr:hypothetical protein CBER1_02219 [Cercospora berteroae]
MSGVKQTLLAFFNYVRLGPDIILIVLRTVWGFLFHSSVYRKYNWGWRRTLGFNLYHSLIRAGVSNPIFRSKKSSGAVIRKACSKNGWPHTAQTLSDKSCPDAYLHEIGSFKSSKGGPVILYFHGGGYTMPLHPKAHLLSCQDYATALGASALFVLEYSLSPGAKYPTQLRQAVLALRYLLGTRNLSPSQIVLGGDSAGGHLAVTLLAHILQPHPEIQPISENLASKASFRGMFLISPWASMRTDSASFQEFDQIDGLSIARVQLIIDLFDPAKDDVWGDLLTAGEKFWAQLPVEKVLVTAGSIECLHDDGVELGRALKDAEPGGTQVETVVAEGEVHVHLAFDYAFGLPMCESRKKLMDWFASLRNPS